MTDLDFEKLRSIFPREYTCGCGKAHRFDGWAYAHFDIVIEHVCNNCKKTNHLIGGRVIRTDEPTETVDPSVAAS